jgi:tetratricopeptide (TPR) repeat protein
MLLKSLKYSDLFAGRYVFYVFAAFIFIQRPGHGQERGIDCSQDQRSAVNVAYVIRRCFSEGQLLQFKSAVIQRKTTLNSDERKMADRLTQLFSINYSALEYIYNIASKQSDEPEDLAKQFAEKLKFHWALIEQIKLHISDTAFRVIWLEVLNRVENGQYTEAGSLILALRDERLLYGNGQSEGESYRPERLADVEAVIGRIALIQSKYSEAAVHFRTASELLADDTAKSAEYLQASADSLYLQSKDNWSAPDLRQAIEIYQQLLQQISRQKAPEFWAETQRKLGQAFLRLGAGQRSISPLKNAVAAFRAVLNVRSKERDPGRWADAQADLGTALFRLGAPPQKNTENLRDAVAAYRLALEEIDSRTAPEKWNTWQNGLGAALWSLGKQETNSVRYLEEAATAFKDALKSLNAERNPRDWGATQNNLGAALFALAERVPGERYLQQSIEAFKASLSAYQDASALYFVVGIRKNLKSAETMLRQRRRQ